MNYITRYLIIKNDDYTYTNMFVVRSKEEANAFIEEQPWNARISFFYEELKVPLDRIPTI